MKLDTATITLIASIVYATQTVAIVFQYRLNKNINGLGLWLAGAVSQALGFLLMPLVSVPSVRILSALANPLVLIGQVMLGIGLSRFLERKEREWMAIPFTAAFLLAYSYFLFIDNSISARSVVLFSATALVACKIAYSIFRGRTANFSASARFTASVFLAYGCFQIAIVVMNLVLPPIQSYAMIAESALRTSSFIAPIIGSMLWTFGFILMINQRLNAENLEEREKMRMFFDISPSAVLIVDLDDSLIVEANAGFLAMTGHTRKEILGKKIFDIDIWDSHEERLRYVSAIKGEGVVENWEFAFKRKDGSEFHGVISGRRIMIKGRAHVMSTVLDFTERTRAEWRIRDLLAEKELLLREVHHRIKNNMSTMQSLLALQAETLKDPVSISALEDAGGRIQSMMVLYDKLYKSAAFGELPISDYLSSLIDEIMSNFHNVESVRVEKKLGDFYLSVDTLQPLGLIVNELLTNIMKYAFVGRTDGVILVSAALDEERVTISISDNGKGMPESVDFDNSPGFGLLLVKALAQQLKGRIGILRGNGTTILLEFERKDPRQ